MEKIRISREVFTLKNVPKLLWTVDTERTYVITKQVEKSNVTNF